MIQKPSKKPLVLAGVAIAVLLAASLSYYVFAMNGNLFGWQLHPDTSSETDGTSKNGNRVNMEPATNNQQQAGQDAKQKTVEEAEKPETSQPTTLTVSITSATQSGSTLRIRAMIQQVVTGTCTLKLQKGGETVTKTAQTYPNASVTTCKGFDVPVSELSSGKWNVTLSVTADKATGAATATVNIEK